MQSHCSRAWLSLIVAIIGSVASACGQSGQPVATSPSVIIPAMQAVPSFAGTWNGVFERTACSRSTGDWWLGYCPYALMYEPVTRPYHFEFEQTGNVVSGHIDLEVPSQPVPLRVTGTVDDAGELVLTQHIVSDHMSMDGYILTSDTTWRLQRSSWGTLAGTVTIRSEGTGQRAGWGQQEGRILQSDFVAR